ncbi:hypothetical protein BU26DRAFT_178523 [Trematosphaeria pertusa]|uniref:Uncharacterized protein n=1 Tax=Trematosphaeria pertusa TaxID=390896 RepID=A0A6A6HTE7_9PLEO|nr:uncharacterized protein BU26DRAFT_178523 [Trematosphaeria pertusa]KAF2241464.1 hypothetical protein BU26DRAFT_178523 [Trematosphaeria pertusa]
MNIDLLINGSEVQSPRPVDTSGPVPQLTTPTTHDPKRPVGINSHRLSLSQIERSASQAPLLEEPPAKKQFDSTTSNSTTSNSSSASVTSVSTGTTETYTTSTYTPPPNHACSAYQPASAASMQGGPVLPAIAEPYRHPQFRPLYSGTSLSATIQPGPPGTNGSPPSRMLKRAASQIPLPEESPAKKHSKWTLEEDNLTIELRG